MNIITTMAAVAALFIIFGVFGFRRDCAHDGGCAGCGAACQRRPPASEDAS